MRTITIKKNVFQYNELDEQAKERVKYWLYEYGFFWADEAYKSLEKFADIFGIKVHSATFDRCAMVGYSTNEIDDNILELSGNRLRTWLINNHYSLLYERKGQGEYKQRGEKWGYKRRSRINYQETCCPFTGVCFDESLLYPIREFIKKPSNITLDDLLGDCINSWEKTAQSDCESQLSDEYISEHCEANGYEFDENGELI